MVGGMQVMAKNKAQWLETAAAEATDFGGYILIKTNLLQPKVSVLSAPGRPMEKWDPRGPLARATWNKVIHDALAKIKHPYYKMAIVLAVVRAPYPRFDPINMNPQFPLEAMINAGLIESISPGQTIYATVGQRVADAGIDFYVGAPDFLPEMMEIIANTIGNTWTVESLGNDYFLTIQPREQTLQHKIPPKELPIIQAIEQVSNIPVKTSLVVEKTHILIQTNIHPPQVGLFVPQGFLPFSLYAAWVKEARAVWVNIIDSHCKNIMVRSIKKAIVLIVFRTQNPYFDPINYDAKVIINILVNWQIIEDDSFDTLVYFAVAQKSHTDEGIDIYVGTPEFLQEVLKIVPRFWSKEVPIF